VPATDGSGTGERYRCQSTDLVRATKPARWWDPRLLARDLLSGNVRARDFVRYGLIAVLNAALSLANRRPYPFLRPRAGDKTPTASLGLQPGERVEVCSEDEIMATIDVEKQVAGLTIAQVNAAIMAKSAPRHSVASVFICVVLLRLLDVRKELDARNLWRGRRMSPEADSKSR
jgi:hypothetical protein